MASPVRIISGKKTNSTLAIGQLLQRVVVARVVEPQPGVVDDVARQPPEIVEARRKVARRWPLTTLATSQTSSVPTSSQAKKKWTTRPVARSW